MKRLRVAAGLFLAPLSWTVQMLMSEPLAAQACDPGIAPRAAPLWPGLTSMLALLSVACLAGAVAGAWAAWTAWRDRRDGGDVAAFLAVLGMMGSVLFFGAIVFSSLAVLLVAPCGRVG